MATDPDGECTSTGPSDQRGLISVEGLVKRYGGVVAVDGLTFQAHPGRVTGFLGPNGAGKSTTLRVLAGLVRPSAGAVLVEGRRYEELDRPASTIGVALEEGTFHPGRTAEAHLRILATAAACTEARVREVLEVVDLAKAATRRVGQFSMGMRQRLGLAAALLNRPHILVLDEPANGLDPQGIRWLRSFLRDQAAGGGTVLVSSHVLSEMSLLADDVVVINRGRLVRAAPFESLVATRRRHRVQSRDAGRLEAALSRTGVEVHRLDATSLSVPSEALDAVVKVAASDGMHIEAFDSDMTTLEEMFLELTTEGAPQ